MNHFQRRDGVLHAEEIPLEDLAREYGTPLYVYSSATLTRHWKVLEKGLSGLPHLTCYAVKANSNLSVLSLFAKLGAGFDIVSGGELYRVLRAGGDARKTVFSGVGKRDDEIAYALEAGVRVLDVESAAELARVSQVARRLNPKLRRPAPIALRVNPDVDPKTHPYIATGLAGSKFGVSPAEALRLYAGAAKDPSLHVKGIAMHIGSQLTDVGPYVDAIAKLRALAKELASQGIRVEHLDIGGGLGIPYDLDERREGPARSRAGRQDDPPHPEAWGAAVKKALRGFDGEVLLEPGRLLVGNAGVLVTRVLYLKRNGRRNFVVVDAAMNDLVRPSLYGAHHAIEPVGVPAERELVADVVGPVCESGDFLARKRRLPAPAEGDLLCIRSAGAYGFAMSSNYNSRPRAAEVLVAGDAALLARARETYEDLVRGEPSPGAAPLGRRRKSG